MVGVMVGVTVGVGVGCGDAGFVTSGYIILTIVKSFSMTLTK